MLRYFDLILPGCLLACTYVSSSNAKSLRLACVYSSPLLARYGVVELSLIASYYILQFHISKPWYHSFVSLLHYESSGVYYNYSMENTEWEF
jgi:hypothetical protein